MAALTRYIPPFVLAPLCALALVAAPSQAQACGGTFCDNLPNPMPVDQRGEDILFVLDGSTVQVHVRIEYIGEAERFAWLLPLQGIPEISVGSEPLFTALSNTTAPRWATKTQYDCDEDDPNAAGTLTFVPFDGDIPSISDPGPEIVLNAVVGAFEVVVLQGGTAAEVLDFLSANNYAQDPAAEPILQQYLDEGFLFAAVKLASGTDVGEIHPLVFEFPGTEPCVPIRLTRIAAEDDMGIRAYFLGQERWAPSSYEHVVLNPLAYNWELDGPDAYLELLSLAVDEAGGHAFATEYAGPSDIVPTWDIYSVAWDETAFIGVDPIMALDLIVTQGLNVHPLIQSLLFVFIPPPANLDPVTFWNNIQDHADQIDLAAWDDVAFAAALSERIIDPGLRTVDLLDAWPSLTRLHTTMSASEMTYDPTFLANPDLPELTANNITTTEQVLCGGDRIYHVDVEGQDTPVCVPEADNYPGWADMPYALRVEQVPMAGPPQVLLDNSEAIAASFTNQQHGTECMAGGGETGDGDGDGGSGTGSEGGPNEGGSESSGGPGSDLSQDVGCGCATQRDAAPIGAALGLLLLGLIGPLRRRS